MAPVSQMRHTARPGFYRALNVLAISLVVAQTDHHVALSDLLDKGDRPFYLGRQRQHGDAISRGGLQLFERGEIGWLDVLEWVRTTGPVGRRDPRTLLVDPGHHGGYIGIGAACLVNVGHRRTHDLGRIGRDRGQELRAAAQRDGPAQVTDAFRSPVNVFEPAAPVSIDLHVEQTRRGKNQGVVCCQMLFGFVSGTDVGKLLACPFYNEHVLRLITTGGGALPDDDLFSLGWLRP